MRDPSVRLAFLFGGLSALLIAIVGVPQDLFSLRMASLEEGPGVFASDLPISVAAVLHHALGIHAGASILTVSALGWLIGVLFLGSFGRTRRDAMLMVHPASVVMVAAGAGFGAFGLVALFTAIRRAAISRAMVDLPVVGLAMALAALTVPEFERLVLPLASVLFLTAPPVMLERQMLSYYLIVFLPALTILSLTTGFGRDLLPLSAPELSGPNIAIAAVAVPSLAWALTRQRTRRLALALLILFAALSLSGRQGLDWPVLAAALAGASAIRGRFGFWAEALSAAATLMIAGVLAMGLTDPASWS